MTHKNPLQFNILPEYQIIIINGFNHFNKEITSIAKNFHRVNESNVKIERLILLTEYKLLYDLFSLNSNNIRKLISTEHAPVLEKHFLSLSPTLPSRCRSYSLINSIRFQYSKELDTLSYNFIDYFYVTIGKINRNDFELIFQNTGEKTTPPIEVFFGLIPPARIFPKLSPSEIGEIMPYFNAKIYQKINLISAMTQLQGKLKEVRRINGKNRYDLSGRLCFIEKPPTYERLRFFFHNLNFILRKTEI